MTERARDEAPCSGTCSFTYLDDDKLNRHTGPLPPEHGLRVGDKTAMAIISCTNETWLLVVVVRFGTVSVLI